MQESVKLIFKPFELPNECFLLVFLPGIYLLLYCLLVCISQTTKCVNTEELRLTGRTRALSDEEINYVTEEVDRLVTSLGRKSVLDIACLEVDEIRQEHLKNAENSW